MSFATAYVATVIIETFALLLLLRKEDKRIVVLAGVLASSITLPILWFFVNPILNAFFPLAIWLFYLPVELLVVALEAAIYKKVFDWIGWRKALTVSLAANLASMIIGFFIL